MLVSIGLSLVEESSRRLSRERACGADPAYRKNVGSKGGGNSVPCKAIFALGYRSNILVLVIFCFVCFFWLLTP